MNSFFNFSSCTVCESPWGSDGLLCRYCRQFYQQSLGVWNSADYKFPVTSFLNWESHNHEFVRRLIVSLKGSNSRRRWELIAKCGIGALGGCPKNAVLVPAPSRLPKGRDHAYFFGKALSEQVGMGFQPVLLHSGKVEKQSLLSKSDRRSRTIVAKARSFQRVVFVDDVITTGATAEAAWRALNYPKFFKVLAFTCRTRLKLV